MEIIYHELWLLLYTVVCGSSTRLVLNAISYVKAKHPCVLKLTMMIAGAAEGWQGVMAVDTMEQC